MLLLMDNVILVLIYWSISKDPLNSLLVLKQALLVIKGLTAACLYWFWLAHTLNLIWPQKGIKIQLAIPLEFTEKIIDWEAI